MAVAKQSAPSSGHQLDGLHRFCNTHHADDSPQVVGEDMQAHFRRNVFKGLHQKVGGSHPELQRAEDMFNRTTPLLHLARIAI